MPLEVRNFGAVDEDVLSGLRGCVILLDLDLDDVRRVLDDFGDVGTVARTDFTKDTLVDPDDTSDEPVTL